MRAVLCLIALLAAGVPVFGATFGSVVPLVGGASDIILDEPRSRLYLVNSSASRVEVYSIAQRRFLNPIRTDAQPISAALSRTGRLLYVTCFSASSLNFIDLDTLAVTGKVTLPASPEGVAVGGDERVLISTIGTGANNQTNTLLVYDPRGASGNNITNLVVTPAPPTPPQLPPPSGRIFLSNRSRLVSTDDGRFIIGANGLANNTRTVFVYEVGSSTVLRSRNVTNLSNVLSVSPDGSKFMAGSSLFETQTLSILAQQNAANAPFSFPGGGANNFNLQQNQGGSVFSPDGSTLYTAFNIAPVQNPAARANVSRLLLNHPENLLITLGLQLPENLVGKMVITRDGANIYTLSESGFMVLPVSTIFQNPVAMPETPAVLLAKDQCGVVAGKNTAEIEVRNAGRGRLSASAQLLQLPPAGPVGLGGFGGPGGGGPGGNIIIILPPVIPGGGFPGAAPGAVGGQAGAAANQQQNAVTQTSPQVQTQSSASGATVRFQFNPNSARSPGTVAPHDFLIQSPEAINIPPNVRVYQNNRDAEARGDIIPVPLGVSASEGLVDIVADNTRQRLYIANSGLNRLEVFDMRGRRFLNPITVGQLPRSLALSPDGSTLYVANSGGESISIVDLERGQTTGRVRFPPIPFNAAVALVTPSVIATGLRGPQIVMSDGTLWKVVGNEAVPRTLNPSVFGTTRVVAGPTRTMASTPGGEFILLLAGNGNAYLYDALADEYVAGRQVVTLLQGYYGPVTAGPRGQYYVVNGTVLNNALTPISSVAGAPVPGPVPGGGLPVPDGRLPVPTGTAATTSRPVAAVAGVGNSSFARFSQPVRLNQNTLPMETPAVELVDVNSGLVMRSIPALEGPAATATGNQRVNVNGRTLAVDAAGTTAYVLTTSGLSVLPMSVPSPADRPSVNANGVVSTASYLPNTAPGALVSVFGRNMGSNAMTSSTPLPNILGGTCVTLNNQPLPLIVTSTGQINAQIPPALAAGRYPLVVRSIDRQVASAPVNVTVSKFAPAVFVGENGQPAILHADGRRVNKDAPAKRDEGLVLYATGLGATKGGRVTAGEPAPENPLAVTDKVQVYFGDPRYKEAEVIVDWSGLVPRMIGLNQINLRVPGAHIRGDALPVTLRIGGVTSPTTGPAVPRVAVD